MASALPPCAVRSIPPLLKTAQVLRQAEGLAADVERVAGDEAPLRTVAPVVNRTRPGEVAKRCPLAEDGELLKSAPSVKGNLFKVANVL